MEVILDNTQFDSVSEPEIVPGGMGRNEPTPPEPAKGSAFRWILELVQTLLMAVILYFLIDTVVARVRVENISMLPTLREGEFLLVNKMAYRFGEVDHGDIIVFHNPSNPQEDYIKRVIGVPGDKIEVHDYQVFLNGYPVTEDYISEPPSYVGEWEVPEGQLFVLGDNRNRSDDSHKWGFVPFENVVGKALVIYWPPSKMTLLNEPFIVNAAAD